jgi:hypothetical protein
MSQIDKYITRVTAGLPTRERVDTAAELRVHLNAQVKKHMLEGHTSEEAEFLAVDAMGAVAKVNRQFLGHIFTPRVGWGLLIASVIGLAGWFGGKAFLDNQTYAREIPVNVKDLLPSLGNYWSFEYRVPKETKSYALAFNTPEFGQQRYAFDNLNHDEKYDLKGMNLISEVENRTIKILLWRPKQDYSKCDPKENRLYYRISRKGTGFETSILLPCKLNNFDIEFPSSRIFKTQPILNKWQALLELEPVKRFPKQIPGNTFSSNQSVVLQVYASSESTPSRWQSVDDYVNDPPPFWDSETNFYSRGLNYNITNGQSDLKLIVPNNTKSFAVAASANGKLNFGKTVDLSIRSSVEKIGISLHANDLFTENISTAEDCAFIRRDVHIALSPGDISFSPCTPFLTKDTPKNTYFGAHIQPQKIPQNIPLETWIPVYALPAHHKPKEFGSPPVIRNVNQWYVVMVKFSSKRQYDGNLPKPKKPFKFKLKNEYVYSSLEVVK